MGLSEVNQKPECASDIYIKQFAQAEKCLEPLQLPGKT